MRFLIDAQLPPGLAKFIQENGHEALHVTEINLGRHDDVQICDYARLNGYTILTKDQDFMDRWLISREKAPVVLIRLGNCTNRALWQWLAPLLAEIVDRLKAGDMLIELT